MTPWDFWTRSMANGMAGAEAGMRFAEMMRASHDVVTSRCATIAQAARDPVNGDYRELSRMVPEKVAAFGSAATSAIADLHAMQADFAANWSQLATMAMVGAMRGRVPSFADLDALGTRTMRMGDRAMAAGDKAMRPLHTAATGNAKRLKRK